MSGDKKKRKPKKPVNTWKFYSKKGDAVEKTQKFCPKCGPGCYMAQHKDRIHCGKCQYTEFTSKK